ncbi:hypothetical protein ONZ43_g7328 [Nemania bipapillata]|uniref:Uncharacterized protein n=1 Tax=Nemania bipapillata TaxID=110536 RepID=A0ACC2HRI4_9PEZI|nr:hypothetical protein ONZ43_g7328 [Nemania bipapillata]
MLSYAGDVQAPSLAPSRAPSVDSTKSGRTHARRTSSRNGFYDLPPGSYGLHGHGVDSTDKLEKAYYEKRPEVYQKEHYQPLHDRVQDYSMSSENLNKIVRDTASRGVGFGTSEYIGTPSEQVGFQASDEYMRMSSRISSPQPPSISPKDEPVKSPLENSSSDSKGEKGNDVIHVNEDSQHKGFAKYGDSEAAEGNAAPGDDAWPILAADEVAKDPSPYELQPAVPPNRHGSDDARSRPSSRPPSIYSPPPPEVHSTPLEDVEEYEPLFPEDEKGDQKPRTAAEKLKEYRQRFPSQDIWEDAPNSVHSTAEVSTPEPADTRPRSRLASADLPPRDTETPAQAFARKQEELAEKEAVTADSFINRQERPKSWVEHQPHLTKEIPIRPSMAPRFPSRDVWEDTPDSLQFTTTVSQPQSADDSTSEEAPKPSAPVSKPVVPIARPPKKQGSGDDGSSKPTIPNRPKPQIPARPIKPAVESKESEGAVKPKPIVPPRPMGSKIAALQAGFMSDLNNRLRLGPQIPKKDVPAAEAASEEKEKAPLADARKGRARGPQRRAPTKSHSPAGIEKSAPPPVSNGRPVLSFSMTRTLWSIDEEGTVMVDNFGPEKAEKSEFTVIEVQPEGSEQVETKEVKDEESKPEEKQTDDAKAAEAESEEVPKQKEPEDEPEKDSREEPEKLETTDKESEITTTPDKPNEDQHIVEETKPVVTNTAGEPVLTETVDKKEDTDEVKEVEEIKDEVAS